MSETEGKKPGFFSRLKAGLTRSTQAFTQGITRVFTRRRLDQAALDELEELLIGADMGAKVAADVVAELKRTRFNADVTEEEIRTALADEIVKILRRVSKPLLIRPELKPHVVLMAGVNGSGKTTTIGKLAQKYKGEGLKVMLAAGDTFRAAAVEQLKVWGERTGCPVMAKETGADAAGLAYEAYEHARNEGYDVLLIDTAGRLQNKAGLMAELEQMVRHDGAKRRRTGRSVPGVCQDQRRHHDEARRNSARRDPCVDRREVRPADPLYRRRRDGR
jgi:fused signal recognition particle receptor